MKIAAAAILVLAIVIGVVPQFTDCQSQGRAIALANGKTVPIMSHHLYALPRRRGTR